MLEQRARRLSSRERQVDRVQANARGGSTGAGNQSLNSRVDKAVDVELLDNLRIFHLHILAGLVPVDQFLQRSRQILVGIDDGNKLTDIETALQRKKTANRIKQERA